MKARILVAGMALFLAACAVQEFPNERKVDVAAGARDRVAIAAEYLQKGENERALLHLRKAIELDPKSSEAHNMMAILLERESDPKGAEKHYRKAISLREEYSQAHNNYGVFLFKRGDYHAAASHLEKAAVDISYQMRASAFEGLGRAAIKLGEKERAENAFLRALKIDPGLSVAAFELADMNFEKQELMAARAYYQRFLKQLGSQPQTARSLWLGIRIERRLGDRNALASYELALKRLYPDSPEYKAYTASQDAGR
jgi:type IV pilus assembly protein PilF